MHCHSGLLLLAFLSDMYDRVNLVGHGVHGLKIKKKLKVLWMSSDQRISLRDHSWKTISMK